MGRVTGPQGPGETMFNHIVGVGDKFIMASYNVDVVEHIYLVSTAT